MKVKETTKNKINLMKLKMLATESRNMAEISKSLGVSKNALRYLLYTDYEDEDNYIQDVKKAFYEGRAKYRINKI